MKVLINGAMVAPRLKHAWTWKTPEGTAGRRDAKLLPCASCEQISVWPGLFEWGTTHLDSSAEPVDAVRE